MTTRLSITTSDLRKLSAVVDKAHWTQCGQGLPQTLLEALNELVPSDEITYQVTDPTRRTIVYTQDLDGTSCCFEQDQARFEAFFWSAFWSSLVCSYPQLTDDKTGVHGVSDFLTNAEFHASEIGEVFRVQQSRYNMCVPLSMEGATDYRIELWRPDGSDFSERERMLLALLRPHLAELDRTHRARQALLPLTARQNELLRYVAAGLTNRQVARQLSISEGTVRRHLENIYERLHVTSRTAAAGFVTGNTSRSPSP